MLPARLTCFVLLLLQAELSATTTDGQPSLTASFVSATPTALQVANSAGQPELREFVKRRSAGPAQLQVAFVPDATERTHATNFVITTGLWCPALCRACLHASETHLAVPPASLTLDMRDAAAHCCLLLLHGS